MPPLNLAKLLVQRDAFAGAGREIAEEVDVDFTRLLELIEGSVGVAGGVPRPPQITEIEDGLRG